MALPQENLARSMEVLMSINRDGIIRATEISRVHRQRLVDAGFLKDIMRGWFMTTNPAAKPGETVEWCAAFWNFASRYLEYRFGDQYHLSAESSILAFVGTKIPRQITIHSSKRIFQLVSLPFGTSFVISPRKNLTASIRQNGVNVMPIADALCEIPASFFDSMPLDAEIAMKMVRDPSEIMRNILSTGKSAIAGRLAGAYRFIGKPDFADAILKTMQGLGYDIREANPFRVSQPALSCSRVVSPYAERIRAQWAAWRDTVEDVMPGIQTDAPGIDETLKQIEDAYVHDAYNSLSIEGYRVTEEMIEKVRDGKWNPEDNADDAQQRNAMAAKGYRVAFQSVKKSIQSVMSGANMADTVAASRQEWFSGLFSPSVQAGIIKPQDLAGFRVQPVYIKDSMHVPPHKDYLADCMDALNECVKNENNPAVAAVLGHFFFVYIHPYMDGNGRTARFMMNAILSSSGHTWTVINQKNRNEYFASLEKASVGGDIEPFARFIASEMACSAALIQATERHESGECRHPDQIS